MAVAGAVVAERSLARGIADVLEAERRARGARGLPGQLERLQCRSGVAARAGFAALVRQYFTDGYYPTGAEVSTNGFTPSAALVKATLVNSAIAMTGTGTTPIPSNCQGWGRVLLENALFFTGQPRRLPGARGAI